MAVTTRAQHLTNAGQTAAEFRQMQAWWVGNRAGVFRTTNTALEVTEKSGTPNMSVDVAAGACAIQADEAGNTGYYYAENVSTTNVVISAADATNPRWDLIVARIKDQDFASGSPSTNTFTVEVVTGTAAASPADPTIPDNCVVLARVVVGALASSIVDANITDLRWAGASTNTNQSNGGVAFHGGIVVCTSSARPTLVYDGMTIYETDTGESYRSLAGSWKFVNRDSQGEWIAYSPTLTNFTATNTARYTRVGDTVTFRYHGVLTGAPSGTLFVSLPATAGSTFRNMFTGMRVNADDVSAGSEYDGVVKIESAGTTVTFWRSASAGGAGLWNATAPFTWAASDVIDFTLTYETI